MAALPRGTAMLLLPAGFAGIIRAFAFLSVRCSWRHAEVLLTGNILTPTAARWRASSCRNPSRGQPKGGHQPFVLSVRPQTVTA